MTNLERDVGQLEARMGAVESELQAIRSDVREIRDALVSMKGGWRALLLVVSLATTVGAVIGRFLPQVLDQRP
jgi:chromosome condensin MukBEF ATPase and DNA-binding subunit MukB